MNSKVDALSDLLALERVSELFQVYQNTVPSWGRDDILRAICMSIREVYRYKKEATMKLIDRVES